MALPTPTFLGQVYTDTASGRSWVCVSLTPPVWAVNKNVLLSIQGGLSVTGGASIAGGLSVTGGATITGGIALYGNVTVNGSAISLSGAVGGSGIANVPLASASVTGVASFGNEFTVSTVGAVSLTSNYVKSFNGLTGAVSGVTTSAANTFTALNTFNAGINSSHLNVTNGVTFGSGLSLTRNSYITQYVDFPSNIGAWARGTFFNDALGTTAGIGLYGNGLTPDYLYFGHGDAPYAAGAGLTIKKSGYVGIGTTTPQAKLDVAGGISATGLYVSNGATFANGLTILGVAGGYHSISSDASNNLNVNSWNYQSYKVGGTEKLYIGAAGISATGLYVSTGATFAGTNGIFLAMNASNPLGTTGSSLVSDSTAAGALRITTPSGYVTIGPFNASYSHFVTDRTTYYFNRPLQINQASGQATIGAYDPSLPFTISTPNAAFGGAVNRITVLTGPDAVTGGYVGIGTTTPQAKLDVNGDTIIRGGVQLDQGVLTTPQNSTYNPSAIHTDTYYNGGVNFSNLPASGVTQGGFALGVQWTNSASQSAGGGPTGYAFLHLLQGGTGAGTTAANAIRVIRANNVQAYVNYAGEFYGLGTKLSSDATLKSNIVEYKDSTVTAIPIPAGKWLPDIRNGLQPYTFTYNNAPELGTRYGYLAQELANVDSKIAGSSFVISEGVSGSSLTGTTFYYISQDQLLFGAVEAIRELDAQACRLWRTSCPPPPSRIKDNDLWFDPTTSKMYMRFNDGTQSQWIQTS